MTVKQTSWQALELDQGLKLKLLRGPHEAL